MLYLQKYLTNPQKSFFGLKEEERGYCHWTFEVHRYFGFAIAYVRNFSNIQKMPKFQFFPITHVPAEMLYLQKYFTNFQKLFLAKRREWWLLWLKISSSQKFWFYRSNVTTFPTSRKCKNFNFSLYTVLEEMLYLQKYLTNFQRLFLSKRRERWLLWLKISSAQIFWFSNSNVTTFATSRKGIEISIFPFALSQRRNAISPEVVLRIFIKFFFAERRGTWLLWFKISSAQIFWFWQ